MRNTDVPNRRSQGGYCIAISGFTKHFCLDVSFTLIITEVGSRVPPHTPLLVYWQGKAQITCRLNSRAS